MTVKNTIFWDMTLYIPVEARRCFGETNYLHFQGKSVSQASNKQEASSSNLQMEAVISSETGWTLPDYTVASPREQYSSAFLFNKGDS
jgi:hypothetical protein